MTEPRLSDRDLQRLFAARTAGAIDPGLADRISRSARQTRQRSPFLVLPGGLSAGPMRALAVAATLSATVLLLAALVIVPGRGPSVTPAPSAPVPPPSTSPSASPSATSSPSPTPSPSPSPTPSPSPSPTVAPSGTPEPTRPTAGGLASLTRDTKLHDGPTVESPVRETLDADTTRLFVIDGPVEAEGRVWWKVYPYLMQGAPGEAHDVGWVSAGSIATDDPAISDYVPDCVAQPIDLTNATAFPVDRFGVIECYGSAPIAITGRMTCSEAEIEAIADGPDWWAQPRWCFFETPAGDPLLVVYGDPVYSLVTPGAGAVTGRFSVTGHFDDIQASKCHDDRHEGDQSDEALALECRSAFVATSVQPLD